MAKNYSIETTDGVTIVRFSTAPSVENVIDAIDDVAENYPIERRLWDYSSGFNLSDAELKVLAAHGKSKFQVPAKLAFIAPADLSFGLSRVYNVHREDGYVDQRVFRNEEEALVWLKKPRST